ncbi:lysozyme inhibitor LprI family protein [Limimaricola sp. AA108-03]|uniref:lysozyme inhibitor LprI family protein n=1 Tax=Limimaricola sp. AA108-03 TaxID=3425945 RepID=UPI003D77F94A
MRFVFLFPLLLLHSLPALARNDYHRCDPSTQMGLNFCAHEEWMAADAELNRLWGVVKPRADARGTGQALLNEQRAWLARRDATCEPEQQGGGSAAPMFYWRCMEGLTLRRNAELRAMR